MPGPWWPGPWTAASSGVGFFPHSSDADRGRGERGCLRDGDAVRLRSGTGEYTGRARLDEIKPKNLEVHWPEGNVLLSREEIDLASHEPDYNAVVRLEKV